MKNISFSLLLSSLLAFSACKKNDLPAPESNNEVATATTTSAKLSAWNQATNWNSNTSGTVTGSLSDASISSEIVKDGLVLVFAQSGNETLAMPFQSKDAFWFYQVSEGSISIFGKGVSNAKNEMSFSYVVLSKEQIENLESKGNSKAQLMNLSFEQAKQLF